MNRRASAAAIAAIVVASASQLANAHIAPAENENNRYVKLTLMGDRLRLAYTIYVGEYPGRSARVELDADRSGDISEAEAKPYGDELGEAVLGKLSFQVDGTRAPLAWEEISVGLGTPATDAGAFSVDMVAWLCLGRGDGGRHRFAFFDHYHVDLPGESELRVEDSPGVRVTAAMLGADGPATDTLLTWRGAGGPTDELGYHAELEVDATVAAFDRERCPTQQGEEEAPVEPSSCPRPTPRRRWWLVAAVAALAVAAAAFFIWRRRDA